VKEYESPLSSGLSDGAAVGTSYDQPVSKLS
jgi:hypothetical protein